MNLSNLSTYEKARLNELGITEWSQLRSIGILLQRARNEGHKRGMKDARTEVRVKEEQTFDIPFDSEAIAQHIQRGLSNDYDHPRLKKWAEMIYAQGQQNREAYANQRVETFIKLLQAELPRVVAWDSQEMLVSTEMNGAIDRAVAELNKVKGE